MLKTVNTIKKLQERLNSMAYKIQLEERTYGGKKFRPQPICHLDDDSNLFLCLTPWGNSEISEIVIEAIKNFIALSDEDNEVTVPYDRKQNLDRVGNILRMAVIMASEKVYKTFNQSSYSAGFEIFAGIQRKNQWTYVCCGQPSLVFFRPQRGTLPIHHNLDLNIRVSKSMLSDPLPNHILGMGQNPPLHFGSQRISKNDRFFLASRSYLPTSLFSMEPEDMSLKNISLAFAEDHEDMPFWLGIINFD